MLNHSLWNSISFNANKNFIFHLSKLFLWKVADEKVANFSGFSFGYFTYIFPLHLILLGRITVHSVHSHLCSLHLLFLLLLPRETFTFFLVLGNFYKEEAFLQLSSVKFSPVIYTSSWEVTAREKQFSGHVYYVSMILGINWKNVRAAESLLLYFFWLELLMRDL